MAPILPQQTVAAIETALLAKSHPDLHAIADVFNTTYQTIRRIKIRLNNFLATGIDPRKAPGRKPKFQDEERTATLMRELISRKPDLHQREIGEYLEKEFGIKACQATVSRLLKRYEIPHKRFKTVEQKHRKGGPPMTRSEVDRELAAAREERRLREEERERKERERLSQAARLLEESSLLANHGQSYRSPYAS